MEQLLTANEVAIRAGISYRRLDHWTARGVLQPVGLGQPGSGVPRLYTRDEARVVAFVGRLVELGCALDTAAVAAESARALTDDEWDGDLIVSRSGQVGAFVPGVTFGEACWLVNLNLCAQRAAA